jgi:hypothetical protein
MRLATSAAATPAKNIAAPLPEDRPAEARIAILLFELRSSE